MNRRRPTPALRLVGSHARVIQPPLIEEVAVAIRTRGPSQRRNRVDNQLETGFARSNCLFCALKVIDIRDQSVPTNHAASAVTRWKRANLKPSVDSIETSKTRFVLERLP